MLKSTTPARTERRLFLPRLPFRAPRLWLDLRVLALYALVALALLAPLASNLIPLSAGGGDLIAHLSGITEARDALKEGQFPIRVAPNVLDGARYPYFQFYGNLPFLLPGALAVLHLYPYAAFKLMLGLALCCGAYFLYRSARLLQRGTSASVLAGVVFMSAPYLLTDIFARLAYPETISFCLLPFVLYTSLRSFLDRRSLLLPILFNGIAWSALAFSHNITFLYGSAFLALFFLSFARWNRRYLERLVRVGLGYGVGLILALWYLVPQLTVLSSLVVAVRDSELLQRGLTPFGTLFAPTLFMPYGSGAPNLGLQVGLPITVAAGVVVYFIATRQIARRNLLVVSRVLLFFFIALLMAWDPKETPLQVWWKLLPKLFLHVQFPYRLLMFVVLWGSLLSAYALTSLFRSGIKAAQFVLTLVVLLTIVANFLPALPRPYDTEFTPDLGKGGGTGEYILTDAALIAHSVGNVDDLSIIRAGDMANFVRHGARTSSIIRLADARMVQLPVFYYPNLLAVRVDDRPASYGAIGRYVALSLPAGEHQITVDFIGVQWANILSAIGWIATLLALFTAIAARLTRQIRFTPPQRYARHATAPAIAVVATALLLVPTVILPYERRSAENTANHAQLAQAVATGATNLSDTAPASFSLNVTFGATHASATEPLLTSGEAKAGDFVYVRYLPDNKIVVAFDHSGSKPSESDPITVASSQSNRIEVVMDRLDSLLIVIVNGQRALRLPTPIYPAKRSAITVGENRIGGDIVGPRFSGNATIVHMGMTNG